MLKAGHQSIWLSAVRFCVFGEEFRLYEICQEIMSGKPKECYRKSWILVKLIDLESRDFSKIPPKASSWDSLESQLCCLSFPLKRKTWLGCKMSKFKSWWLMTMGFPPSAPKRGGCGSQVTSGLGGSPVGRENWPPPQHTHTCTHTRGPQFFPFLHASVHSDLSLMFKSPVLS